MPVTIDAVDEDTTGSGMSTGTLAAGVMGGGSAIGGVGGKEKTPQYFKNEALKKIDELRVPRRTIVELQSSLELIMQRYEFDKSYLDKAAEWYAKTAWWYETAGILLLWTASGAMVGLTIGAAIAPVFALLAIGIYFATTFLLMEHYTTTTRRDKRLREHFSTCDETIIEAITLLESAEKQVENILISLCELNIKSADKLKSFEEQIATLTVQSTTYLETIQKLETATDSIARDNEIIARHLQSAAVELEKEPAKLNTVINTLKENHTAVSVTSDDCVGISKKMQTNVTSLAHIVIGFQEQLTILKQRVVVDEQISEKLQASANETLDTNIDIDKLMRDSAEALLNADSAFDEFNTYMASLTVNEDGSVPPVEVSEKRFFNCRQ